MKKNRKKLVIGAIALSMMLGGVVSTFHAENVQADVQIPSSFVT